MPDHTKSDPIAATIEAATEKAGALSEQVLATGKQASARLLDSYEHGVEALSGAYVKAARSTNVDWITTVSTAQADFAREATKSYTSLARGLAS